jgi:CYTH domain-containing protein
MVYKTRYLIPLEDGLTAELDIFEGVLTGLIYALKMRYASSVKGSSTSFRIIALPSFSSIPVFDL